MRRSLPLGAVIAALLVAASPAGAATVSVSGGTMTYMAAAGRVSQITFTRSGSNVRVEPSGADNDTISPQGACTSFGTGGASCPGVTNVVADLDDGDDQVDGRPLDIPIAVTAGTGNDTVFGGSADDNSLDGGAGNDTIDGGPGDDGVIASGSVGLDGGPGNDIVRGGSGDDTFLDTDGTGADTYAGGDGYDTFDEDAPGNAGITVTLDDQANDGVAGEGDNVGADVEAVNTDFSAGAGNDSLTGNAAFNTLNGGAGSDTIDGGAGNDRLAGGPGDDTIRARDGYADSVSCGSGTDTATVDTLDTVSSDCETVDRADAGNANEDRAPAVAWTSPALNARLPSNRPTTLAVDAGDDRGIASVRFVDDGRDVCTDNSAPYTCLYQPRGDDVGANTLLAIATDTSGQTATAVRVTDVGLFAARLSSKLSPARDRTRPWRFRLTGRVVLPGTVAPALGCGDGVVSVQVKAGTRTVSTRRVEIRSNCSYSSTVTFRDRSRLRTARSLRFLARFTGNGVVAAARATTRTGRLR